MFMDEMDAIDRATAVDQPFAKYLRTPRFDHRDPHRGDREIKNPNFRQPHFVGNIGAEINAKRTGKKPL